MSSGLVGVFLCGPFSGSSAVSLGMVAAVGPGPVARPGGSDRVRPQDALVPEPLSLNRWTRSAGLAGGL